MTSFPHLPSGQGKREGSIIQGASALHLVQIITIPASAVDHHGPLPYEGIYSHPRPLKQSLFLGFCPASGSDGGLDVLKLVGVLGPPIEALYSLVLLYLLRSGFASVATFQVFRWTLRAGQCYHPRQRTKPTCVKRSFLQSNKESTFLFTKPGTSEGF